jgi:hypothetical protein
MSNVEVADDIIGVIRQVIGQFSMKNLETESIEVPISVKLWRVPGCHELLASLGKTSAWGIILPHITEFSVKLSMYLNTAL